MCLHDAAYELCDMHTRTNGERSRRARRQIRALHSPLTSELQNRARTSSRADEKRKRVRELRARGLSIRAIANETAYSVGAIHRYVKQVQNA